MEDDYIPGTRTSDTAIRLTNGEVIMKDDLIEKVADAIWDHEKNGEGCNIPWREATKRAIAVVLRDAIDNIRAPGNLGDFTTKYLQAYARENGINLDE